MFGLSEELLVGSFEILQAVVIEIPDSGSYFIDHIVIVSYEQLTCTFVETVALVAGHILPGVSVNVAPPRTRVMADDHSVQLLGRHAPAACRDA